MLLQLQDVKKTYKDFELNCTFKLEEGKITGLIGQNGAGKSTAFKAILDLIKIESGNIQVLGKQHNELTAEDREKIGVVLSDSGFNDTLCIKDVSNILKAMYSDFDEPKFISKCEHFNLPLNKKISTFSTGMKAKFKLLVAISHKAKLLILDEPTSGLDVVVRDELLELLQDYMKEDKSRGVLISSHISTDLESICDDIYMISDGKVIFYESIDVILRNYGILKLEPEQYKNLDTSHVLKSKKDRYGYSCLTDNKQYYQANHPEYEIEKGNLDQIITILIKGE